MCSLYTDAQIVNMGGSIVSQKIFEDGERRKGACVFAEKVADGSPIDPALAIGYIQDKMAARQSTAFQHYYVPGDVLFALKLEEYGNSIEDIYLTLATLCEARMDKEILEVIAAFEEEKWVEEAMLALAEGGAPVVNAYIDWQEFTIRMMTDFDHCDYATIMDEIAKGAESWWRGEGALYPVYVEETVNPDDLSPTGLCVCQADEDGSRRLWGVEVSDISALICGDELVPKEAGIGFHLAEISEDIDLFDMECDMEYAMMTSISVEDNGDFKPRDSVISKDGPAEELGIQCASYLMSHDVDPNNPSVYFNITTARTEFKCSNFGPSYHTAEWKYGKAFIGLWDASAVCESYISDREDLSNFTYWGNQRLRFAGGALRWRVINPTMQQKVMGKDSVAALLNSVLFNKALKIE